mmetsp:Transcript_56301/g.163281  ORF Transcript_56301/g.163281 Transcript_56301/m.163281 type:complete len:150 (+) Transcript_56301:67-516(+)
MPLGSLGNKTDGRCSDFASRLNQMIQKKCKGGLPPITFSSESVERYHHEREVKSTFCMDNALDIFQEAPSASKSPPGTATQRGRSCDGQSRKVYLRQRYKKALQERYAQPVTRNMEYGFYQPPAMEGNKRGGRASSSRPRAAESSIVLF